ncbi:substrate-binding domain-containing protein [Cohnella zeiphila]|uniref:Substrate-binding domain-containing protein n=1 Tax=Cohnella zeiphila TaxID=2761120 RepID=A0A7X0SM35_9BACL|nr:substrate-binding domain-containing protein [Cohnella zeiphila]MBB6732451.1 substrate-binding domain-containing protein [Cohnella zeiphila]
MMRLRRNAMRLGLAAWAAALMLTACSRQVELQPAPDERKQVVLLAKSKNGDYWNTIKMGAEAAAKEFGVQLTFDGADEEDDVARQQELVRQYVAYGADAIVLAASDYGKLAEDVDNAVRKGVPVVAVDSEVASNRISSFIGIDNYKAGREAADKLKELAGSKGRFVILGSSPDDRNDEQRKKGIVDEWSAAPGMSVARTLYCGPSVSACESQVRSVVEDRAPAPVDGILALNAAASVGAAEALRQTGTDGRIKLVAFENSLEELEWLQEGVIQATLIQNPFTMGYLSVKTALAAAAHQKVDRRIDTETRVIDSESMFWSDNQKMLFPFVQ